MTRANVLDARSGPADNGDKESPHATHADHQAGDFGCCLCRARLPVSAVPALAAVHGFYRFFAWESILVLFVANVEFWFRDPLSLPQLASWILLIASAYLVVAGVVLLRRHGSPDNRRQDVTLVGFEKTTRLVEQGVYRYIRHPLYSSLLLLAWGIFLKHPAWLSACLVVVATAFLVATARADEAESRRFFGPAYETYKKRTKMFIPFVL